MRMRLPLSIAVATALLVLVAPRAAAQTVDELVAKNIAARGGMAKIKAIDTLKITRTVATGIGNNVRVIIYKKRPQLYRGEQGPAQPGATLIPRGVNADDAWDTVQGKITTRPEPAESETRELDADFDGLLIDWKEKGYTVSFEGQEALPGGDTHKLKVTTKSGAVRTVYLDAKTRSRAPARRSPDTPQRPEARRRRGLLELERDQRREVRVRHQRGPRRPQGRGAGAVPRHLHGKDRSERADGGRALRHTEDVARPLT